MGGAKGGPRFAPFLFAKPSALLVWGTGICAEASPAPRPPGTMGVRTGCCVCRWPAQAGPRVRVESRRSTAASQLMQVSAGDGLLSLEGWAWPVQTVRLALPGLGGVLRPVWFLLPGPAGPSSRAGGLCLPLWGQVSRRGCLLSLWPWLTPLWAPPRRGRTVLGPRGTKVASGYLRCSWLCLLLRVTS